MTLLNFYPIIFIAIFRGALMLVCRFCLPWTAFSASGCFMEKRKKKKKKLNCWKIVQVENKVNQTRPWKCLLLTAYSLSQNIVLTNVKVKQILMTHYMTSIKSFKQHLRSQISLTCTFLHLFISHTHSLKETNMIITQKSLSNTQLHLSTLLSET